MKTCHECGKPVRGNNVRCQPCRLIQSPLMEAAHGVVKEAVRAGELPSLRANHIPCVDCGNRACDYDHRDHMRTLDVEPVCRPCNNRRGPADPILARLLCLLAFRASLEQRAA